MAFSPDGRQLAAGLRNGNILIWDTASPNPSAPPTSLAGGVQGIWGPAFTADGTTLVSASGREL
jgi:WD40 repeat protein